MNYEFKTKSNLGTISKSKVYKFIDEISKKGIVIRNANQKLLSSIDSINYHQTGKLISTFEAQKKIWKDLDLNSLVSQACYFEDIFLVFYYQIRNKSDLEITLNPCEYWKRKFEGTFETKYPDNVRTTRVLLDLIEPFVIKSFNLGGEYQYEPNELFNLPEGLPKNCIGVEFASCGYSDFLRYMLDGIISQGFYITFNKSETYLPDYCQLFDFFANKDLVTLYLRKDSILVKVTITPRALYLFPLEPYVIKTFEDEKGLDLHFYIKLLLAIIDFIPIKDLRTNF